MHADDEYGDQACPACGLCAPREVLEALAARLSPAGVLEAAERWAPIPGFPGYDASSLGRVRSWHVRAERAPVAKAIRSGGAAGYPNVTLRGARGVGGEQRQIAVHAIVLRAFVGMPEEGQVCRHLDGDRSNARLDNLAYGSYADNAADAIRHGTQSWGESHGNAALSLDKIQMMIDARRGGASFDAIAREHGCNASTVNRVLHGQTWSRVTAGVAGELPARCHVSAEKVQAIHRMAAEGALVCATARALGLSHSFVSRVRNGKASKAYAAQTAGDVFLPQVKGDAEHG
jgi:transposase-like protein